MEYFSTAPAEIQVPAAAMSISSRRRPHGV
jgi:hypothetical protein